VRRALRAERPGGASGGIASDSITLTWADNSSNETGFEIEASTDGGTTFELYGYADANATCHNVGWLDPDTTYKFRVRAQRDDAPSCWSNVLTTGTASLPPTPRLA